MLLKNIHARGVLGVYVWFRGYKRCTVVQGKTGTCETQVLTSTKDNRRCKVTKINGTSYKINLLITVTCKTTRIIKIFTGCVVYASIFPLTTSYVLTEIKDTFFVHIIGTHTLRVDGIRTTVHLAFVVYYIKRIKT